MTKKYGPSTQNKRYQCKICESFESESSIDVQTHIMNYHNLRERIDELTGRTIAEDSES